MSSKMLEHSLWIIGPIRHLPFLEIWQHFFRGALLDGALVSFRAPEMKKSSIRASVIEELLNENNFPFFEIEGEAFSFSYGQNGGANFDQIIIESRSFILTPDFSRELLLGAILDTAHFTQAHLVDSYYQRMQNIFDPIQFRALGVSMEGLPVRSNGLPFPLEQKIVDTSQNPGRFDLRSGYVEASAGYMWFGDNFWQIVGTKPDSVLAKLPEHVSLRCERLWCLASATGVFKNLETRETQDKIRHAVFGKELFHSPPL